MGTDVRKTIPAALAVIALILFCTGCGGGDGGRGLIGSQIGTIELPLPEPAPRTPFTLIVIPDSQYAVMDYPALFSTQMQWIVDNKTELNIVYMLHEGDITNNNTKVQYENALSGLNKLDGVVPYALAAGNHDTGKNGDMTNFNKYFPASKYSGLPTFGGMYEDGKMENCYHYFSAGGIDWMILVLEFRPRDEVIEWANQIATANQNRRVIVLTHAFLCPDDTRCSTSAQDMWDNFVKLHKNITFVFSGHYTDDTAARLVSEGDKGNKVYQMMADYQDLWLGGTGFLRIVKIDPEKRKVAVKTYTPLQDEYMADTDNQFEFDNVDLDKP